MEGRPLVFSIGAHRRKHVTLLFVGGLVATLGLAVVNPAVAGKPSDGGGGSTVLPTPTRIVVTGVTSDFTRGAELPPGGLPSVVVQAGGPLVVAVRFEDADGNEAAFKKDTALDATSNVGRLGPVTGTALKGISTATVTTSVTTVVNRVVLTVGAGSGRNAPEGGPSVMFDVLAELEPDVPASNGVAFEQGIGGDTSCTAATPAEPVCGVVRLPRGAATNVLLSVGACDKVTDPEDPYAPCLEGPKGPDGAVVQSLFSQPTDAYRTDSPAAIILKCDKTLCGTGSIRARTVLWSLGGNAPLVAAEACPGKNTMAAEATPCVDYVQSTRDGSGDTHLFLLTDRDIRTGIG